MSNKMLETFETFFCHAFLALARLAVRHGFKFQQLNRQLKMAFVEAAREEVVKNGRAVSTSIIAAVSGLQRKDVDGLLGKVPRSAGQTVLYSKVISQWESNPEYLGADLLPRMLECSGFGNEFFRLVHSVSTDMNPYTILFDLERTGVVEKLGSKARLVARHYAPSQDVVQSLDLLAYDLNDLVRAVDQNVFYPQDGLNLHVTTRYDNIPIDKIDELREEVILQGSRAHEKIKEAISLYDSDVNPALGVSDKRARVAVGSFSFIEIDNKAEG